MSISPFHAYLATSHPISAYTSFLCSVHALLRSSAQDEKKEHPFVFRATARVLVPNTCASLLVLGLFYWLHSEHRGYLVAYTPRRFVEVGLFIGI